MADSPEEIIRFIRATLSAWLNGQERPKAMPELAARPSQGCFVSLKTRSGRLRGCIGTLTPTRSSLADELAENTLAAASRDPRFKPLTREELDDILISVDLLSPPEPIPSPEHLDPRRFGVVVRSGSQCGVLLPDLPGVNQPGQQVSICREKAGIPERVPVRLERFTVERFGE
ncbi:MAG: AmmeMemoRadiSam system protein A [Deltaproteobacteria bacterium]|nr:AmmeMemoRadiSam system protein A [Deltaproteobacteria bacterium]